MLLAVLPEWLSNLANDASGLMPLFAFAAVLIGMGRWVLKRFIRSVETIVSEQMKPFQNQMFPNGGSSLVDKVNKLSDDLSTHIDQCSSHHDQISAWITDRTEHQRR